MKYSATIELLTSQRAAIVALFDSSGEWSGAGRFELSPRAFEDRAALASRLYEAGYVYASRAAACKGGSLESYREHRE